MLILIVELILHASPTSLINTMSEKFSLKWIDYQSNFNRSLAEFRNQTDLSDVTLISDDKVKFSAHKIILSSCSNMFKFIFKDSAHANPLLYLGGVSSVNLGFVLDYIYIYYGEVNLFQEQLDSFLESAEKLEIEGLIGGNKDHLNEENTSLQDEIKPDQTNKEFHYQQVEEKQIVRMEQTVKRRQSQRLTQVTTFDVRSCTPEEIEQKTRELYENRDGVFSCLVCEHTASDSSNIKRHVEVHLEGLSYQCTVCNKEFRSKNSLVKHKSIFH